MGIRPELLRTCTSHELRELSSLQVLTGKQSCLFQQKQVTLRAPGSHCWSRK